MKNIEKQMLKDKMEVIEALYQKAKSDDQWNELDWLMRKYKIRGNLGILEANRSKNALTKIVELCDKWLEENGDKADLLMNKGWLGVPLTTAEKVELAKYHCTLTYMYIGYETYMYVSNR